MDKAKRLNNIFGKDGKTIIVALDGFGFSANTDGVDFSVKSVHQLLKYGLNCALVTYGQAQLFAQDLIDVPTILRVDGSVNVFDSSVPETAQFFDVTDALKLGASGVVCMTFPGSQGGREEFSHKMLARLAKQGEEWNVPVIAETLPCSYAVSDQEPNSDNPDYIKTAARLGVEYGADVIKTRFTGDIETDRKIVENTRRPAVALGGPKTDNKTYFEYVHNLMTAGVCGIATGRNITQDPNPVGKVAALSAIVHDGKTVEEALQIYSTTKS
ncbi:MULTISPECIES: class I fructose-bisphosphate aldolase [Lactobacillus]|uniref:class I fructose-bisphosphate aldolase n=1 Tax=Lactobacillus TaxID=1578 RepID=UPI00050D1FB3|nr:MULTISPECIES: phospho-2-dehydro-3-deoxyheptonate aldolase [Lactobacillus]AIS08634.1 2-amino-3,7-dideoxy-D-threo-hept-6-ulosonate synthase [Lactobacillus sp. wkB8]MBC6356733.1 phospho-2-dehydro-3-deoxyheptonate aldolase [Lactobacillus helsingborgensis]MBI0109603.1 phospho-2-dehydro-3-deoxyheptonate aldolase [Lactobacillus sp. W8093]MCT6828498.1 phospho-2-dehydro-3-deoxyheptonate aldolase [Lactobacillus helsingborgensis]MCT6847602.1 phospho-2-dehydro-3-deoxyheptonate aldolase [Lactobacillus h